MGFFTVEHLTELTIMELHMQYAVKIAYTPNFKLDEHNNIVEDGEIAVASLTHWLEPINHDVIISNTRAGGADAMLEWAKHIAGMIAEKKPVILYDIRYDSERDHVMREDILIPKWRGLTQNEIDEYRYGKDWTTGGKK